jgi:two-component system OmpR family response regulator
MSLAAASSSPVARVLVVDDEPLILQLCEAVLDQYEVVTAADVASAMAILSMESFDAILSDVWMPGRSGLDFLALFRSVDTETPFLLLTASPDRQGAERAARLGATRYLSKPVDPVRLRREIADAVGWRRTQHSSAG